MGNILAVDDETAILIMIQKILCKDGHNVTTISDPTILTTTKLDSFDLILLDIMMPQMDGFALCAELRNRVDCPILFLTAKTEENSLVCGLETGADDYICKPFGASELQARVAAHIRREHREHFVRLSLPDAQFNLSAKQLIVHGSTIPLTQSEYQICELLARN